MMDTEMTTPSEPPVQVVFRGKKRKAYRQRGETGNDVHADVNNAATAPASDPARNTPIAPTDNPSPAPPQASGAIPAPSGAKGGEDVDAAEEDERGLSVAEVLRRRNARRSRLGGVKFSAIDSAPPVGGAAGGELDYNNNDDLSLMIREEEGHVLERSSSAAAGVTKRFAPQTGLSSELINKHMEEYIEAKLAKKHEAAMAAAEAAEAASFSALQQQQQRDRDSANHNDDDYDNYSYDDDDGGDDDEPAAKIYAEYAGKLTSTSQPRERHTALQGKLLEVDLGDEVRSRNAAMTERARRRLLGEAVDDDDGNERSGRNGRPNKVRLGRDGKPWRPRNRRGSDDVKRDQIVEAILHENSLDVYEKPKPRVLPPSRASVAAAAAAASAATISGAPVPAPAAAQAGTSAEAGTSARGAEPAAEAGPCGYGADEEEEGALDDRIAEQFRREFMEAMAERRQRRRKAPLPPSKAAAAQAKRESDEILRGPKLGGSRNARAAMRDILLKQQEERKAQQPGGGSSSVKPRGLPPRRIGGRR